jgi:hypothetical protein
VGEKVTCPQFDECGAGKFSETESREMVGFEVTETIHQ